MSRHQASTQLLDPALVRHRRLELGLTESYLGSLCGVSAGVIRRLEVGRPQDNLSARFLHILAEQLGTTLAALLVEDHSSRPHAPAPPDVQRDARDLGALLLGAGEPVPVDALCSALRWDMNRIDAALQQLAVALDAVGGVVIDNGSTLRIVDDIAPIDRDTLDTVSKAAFARRRPTLAELRAILQLVHGKVTRREDLDTVTGRTLGRLRNLGVLDDDDQPGTACTPPTLHDDVRYSLMLECDPKR